MNQDTTSSTSNITGLPPDAHGLLWTKLAELEFQQDDSLALMTAQLLALRAELRRARRQLPPLRRRARALLADIAADLSMWVDDVADLGERSGQGAMSPKLLAAIAANRRSFGSSASAIRRAMNGMRMVEVRLRRLAPRDQISPRGQLFGTIAHHLKAHRQALGATHWKTASANPTPHLQPNHKRKETCVTKSSNR